MSNAQKTETPATPATPAPHENMSAADSKFSAVLFTLLPKSVDIDWTQFAHKAGLKNASVAKTRYSQIRTKLGIGNPALDQSSSESKAIKPNNSKNKVTKARKPAKTKQPKSASKVVNDAADDQEMNSVA
ncbi:hypothetical protein NUW58_g4980 [Xylaria curta]|uniref:Uncharacterized protein n=1 Tax=Xylaria curta TaxID=42375 RepID=A0ACC1P6F8_9PEZI|nr:hypothetical protein NUW58_g4980 [Xylaria curta]